MYNLRQLNKYFLSGGWQYPDLDAQILKDYGIVAVLDLQYTEEDDPSLAAQIKEKVEAAGMEYRSIPFSDWAMYTEHQLHDILENAHKQLTWWEDQFPYDGQYILIKCAAGISRSGTVYLYHTCKRDGASFHEALAEARDAEYGLTEFGISPNNVFWNFLATKFPFEYGVN